MSHLDNQRNHPAHDQLHSLKNCVRLQISDRSVAHLSNKQKTELAPFHERLICATNTSPAGGIHSSASYNYNKTTEIFETPQNNAISLKIHTIISAFHNMHNQ